jgi:putative colanic acid biosynthesis acetyltransferase WcaB
MFIKIRNAIIKNPNFKGRIVVCSYILMRYFRVRMDNNIKKIIFIPIILIYKIITDLILKCEIPASVKIGDGLVIHHAIGLVINSQVVIGDNVTLKHNTTIGNKEGLNGENLGSPIIGNNVIIGPHSIIIGPIKIGDNSIIGAGSVVIRDVPSNAIVAGNPARVIKLIN